MSILRKLETEVRRWWYGDRFKLWYHPDYRLPITSLESVTQIEPRRADFVAWYLLDEGAIDEVQVIRPRRIPVRDMARVHDCAYLEALTQPETLAEIFSVAAWDVPVDEVLRTIRLACGATLDAARDCLAHHAAALNALGGFHHAFPDRGQRMCPLNDIAIAVKTLRHEGWKGQVVILDLDAHPPHGLAACLKGEADVWIGSLSAWDDGPLDEVDETLLPQGCDDPMYLTALDALLKRMPSPDLAFVIAGGDILAGDPHGGMGLSLEGARTREARVCEALSPCPTVWLPGGGYHPDAWRVLAGAGLYLAIRSSEPVSSQAAPLKQHFRKIASTLTPHELDGELFVSDMDIQDALGVQTEELRRVLDFYSRDGIELALYQFGILSYVRRLGYRDLEIRLARASMGDRMQLIGHADGQEWLLIELILEKVSIDEDWWLYVHWMTLRHPKGQFTGQKAPLPGQEVPGLGLAKESSEMLDLIARRLQLKGVAMRPSWFHVAYSLRRRFRFADPARQGRFEALIRDVEDIPLKVATRLVAEEQFQIEGAEKPYQWEADLMVFQPHPPEEVLQQVAAVREATRFVRLEGAAERVQVEEKP